MGWLSDKREKVRTPHWTGEFSPKEEEIQMDNKLWKDCFQVHWPKASRNISVFEKFGLWTLLQ